MTNSGTPSIQPLTYIAPAEDLPAPRLPARWLVAGMIGAAVMGCVLPLPARSLAEETYAILMRAISRGLLMRSWPLAILLPIIYLPISISAWVLLPVFRRNESLSKVVGLLVTLATAILLSSAVMYLFNRSPYWFRPALSKDSPIMLWWFLLILPFSIFPLWRIAKAWHALLAAQLLVYCSAVGILLQIINVSVLKAPATICLFIALLLAAVEVCILSRQTR